jgi:two-component system OmpR family sensor kinase
VSLRTRVLAGLGLVAVVLLAVALLLTRTTRDHLVAQVDAQLAAAVDPGRAGGRVRRPGTSTAPGPERLSDVYEGLLTTAGLRTLAQPNLTSTDTPQLQGTETEDAAEHARPFTAPGTGGTRFRVLATVDPASGGLFVVAIPLTDVDATLQRLAWFELAGTGFVLGVLALVGWWVVHLGVRPVNRMAATAAAIAGGDLSQRVPEAARGTEAGRLAGALNQMLGNLEDSFQERVRSQERLRRFVADASHELRTPITTIRGYAELYRHGGLAAPGAMDEAMRRTEQESLRMARLVEDMLQLAKLDEGRPLEQARLDLAALVRDAAADARAVAPERPITCRAPEPVAIVGDEDRVRQVLANVVANALVHTPADRPVELALRRDGERAVVEVVDHGDGMAPEVAARVTERFFRADASRSRHCGGSGLGLAIVDATVVAHGGTLTIDSEVGRGTTVRLELPVAGAGWAAPSPGPAAPA